MQGQGKAHGKYTSVLLFTFTFSLLASLGESEVDHSGRVDASVRIFNGDSTGFQSARFFGSGIRPMRVYFSSSTIHAL